MNRLRSASGEIHAGTDNGERLLVHARRMVKLNEEASSAFRAPDDYADRFLAGHISRSLQSAGAQRAAAE